MTTENCAENLSSSSATIIPISTQIDRKRLTNYPRIFIVLYMLLLIFWFYPWTGLIDRQGKNVGVDFLTFWTASQVVLEGVPEKVYDLRAMHPRQNLAVRGVIEPYAFHYPPTFLLFCAPLSCFPFLLSLLIWLVFGVVAFLFFAKKAVPDPLTLGLALAFPGVYQNVFNGQNGLFTTALLGGAIWLLDSSCSKGKQFETLGRYHMLAGFMLGLLTFKPHIAVVVFVALATGKYWKAFGSAILTAGFLIFLSILLLGFSPWVAFFNNLSFTVQLLQTRGALPWVRMPTVQVASMLLGLPAFYASLLQTFAAIIALLAMIFVWKKTDCLSARVTALVGAIFLVTPFGFDYDQALLALPIAAVGKDILDGKRQPGDSWMVLTAWIAPLLMPFIAQITSIQLSPLLSLWLIGFAIRRVLAR